MAKRTKPDRQLIPTTKRAGSPVVSGGLLDDVRNHCDKIEPCCAGSGDLEYGNDPHSLP